MPRVRKSVSRQNRRLHLLKSDIRCNPRDCSIIVTLRSLDRIYYHSVMQNSNSWKHT